MIEMKIEELNKMEEEILNKDLELKKKQEKMNRKQKDLKKKDDEILSLFDQYNNINMATTDPNHTRIPKQRWYTLNVEYSKNDQTINQKLSLKASSLDDLKKKK